MSVLSLDCGGKVLDLTRSQVMGILNVTPDSFSDGGDVYTSGHVNVDDAVAKALKMVKSGATIIDIGGESTRPGASPVAQEEEWQRVVPVVEAIAKQSDVIISVDTSRPEIMTAAAKAGAGMINDVRALTLPGALEAAAASKLPVCVMHMQGKPDNMQNEPVYYDVLAEVERFLVARIEACEQAGILRENIILDPGFGFGKTVEHNLSLLNNLTRFHKLGCPLLVGTSRKSMIGHVLGKNVDQRLHGSLATIAVAAMQGAQIYRVHDVTETLDVVRMVDAIRAESIGED